MNKYPNVRNEFYCIVIYDVNQERVQKVHKILKAFLNHKQNSVFEGLLKKSEFVEIENKLKKVIDKETDKITFLMLKNKDYILEIELGLEEPNGDLFY